MANRDFSKIERIMKDFSLGVGEGGEGSGLKVIKETSKLTLDFSKQSFYIDRYSGDPTEAGISLCKGNEETGCIEEPTKLGILFEVNEAGTQLIASLCLAGINPYQSFTNQVVIYEDSEGGLDKLNHTSTIMDKLPTVEFTNFEGPLLENMLIVPNWAYAFVSLED